MGSGVPQYRRRDSAQSTRFSSQLPNRPSPMCGGCQSISLSFATSPAFFSVVRMNQLVVA